MTNLNAQNLAYLERIENELSRLVFKSEQVPNKLSEAIGYSLLSGGKRIRPLVFLNAYAITAQPDDKAFKFACAIECMHSYSLVHDDLPCMDNDSVRRNKPSCHVAYGYGAALLVGDSLLNMSFECANELLGQDGYNKSARLLAQAGGCTGMIGGQYLDTEGYKKSIDDLLYIYSKKTGALFHMSALCGGYCSNSSDKIIAALDSFGQNFGLAFQLYDDLTETEDENETTVLTFMPRSKAIDLFYSYYNAAVKAVESLPNSQNLLNVASLIELPIIEK